MGFRFSLPVALSCLLAAPAFAQQDNGAQQGAFNLPQSSAGQPANPRQQGPELDVFRAPATQPVTAPPIVTPPIVAPTIAPTPVPAPATTRPAKPTPAPVTKPKESPTPSPPATLDKAPASVATENGAAPPVAVSPVAVSAPAAPTTAAPTPAPASPTPWGWIAAGFAALLAAIAAILVLRRRAETDMAEPEVAEPEILSPAIVEKPNPAPPPPTAPDAAPQPDRPQLDLALEVKSARFSLMGVTIAYVLAVHNRGSVAAEDMLIRVLLANAGTAQQASLDQFLDGSTGLPAHGIASLAPGEGHWLNGELRLAPDDIAPLQVGDRALLVPLALFDVQYRWLDAHDGRLARSFLIGQEPTNGGDRLAPLRMDTGPRQFRAPAARVVGDLVTR